MAMDPQHVLPDIRFIQHNVIRPREAPQARHVDPDPEHLAVVHGVRVRVLDRKCRDAGACSVEVLLVVRKLLGGGLEERGDVWRPGGGGVG